MGRTEELILNWFFYSELIICLPITMKIYLLEYLNIWLGIYWSIYQTVAAQGEAINRT